MKKGNIIILSILLFGLTALSACNSSSSSNPIDEQSINEKENERDPEIERIYNLYLSNGGTLTYEEWLATIKGEKGDPGKDGKDGVDGKDGKDGKDGQDGHDGKDGNNGTSLLTGSGEPALSLGKNGDSYIDLSTWDFYLKENDAWVLKGNIKATSEQNEEEKIEYFDDEGEEGTEGLSFYIQSDGSYSVGVGTDTQLENVIIPNTHNGRPVTRIIDEGFKDCNQYLKSVSIGKNIKTIGRYAFSDCSLLEEVTFRTGLLETIEHYAFSGCSLLKEIILPSNVKDIYSYAFYQCSSLENIVVSEGTRAIYDHAFYDCHMIKNVTLPDSLELISEYVFGTSSNFSNFGQRTLNHIPKNLTYVGNCAFTYFKVESLTLSEKWQSLRENNQAFRALEIGTLIFDKNLESLALGTSYVFNWCTINTFIISKNIKSIASSLFDHSTLTDKILYEGTSTEWANIVIGSNNSILTVTDNKLFCYGDPSSNDCFIWYYNDQNEIETRGHDFVLAEVECVAPQCSTDGLNVEICTRCGERKETKVPSTGHQYVITENESPDGCTESSFYHCSVCNKRTIRWDAKNYDETLSLNPNEVEEDGSIKFKTQQYLNGDVTNQGTHYIYKIYSPERIEDVGFSFLMKPAPTVANYLSMVPIFNAVDSDSNKGYEMDENNELVAATKRYGLKVNGTNIELGEDTSTGLRVQQWWIQWPVSFTLEEGINTIDVYCLGGYRANMYEFEIKWYI